MMNIKIICVGKIKEDYLTNAINEYLKRLSKYSNVEIIEVPDEKLPSSLTIGNIRDVKNKEGDYILNKLENIKANKYIFCLDESGEQYNSENLARHISNITTNGNSTLIFIIGGSLGLNEKVKQKANEIISFSKLTFPHQMIRVFLLEQIFRVFKILNSENYHH